MRIFSTEYSLNNKCFEIYLSGCKAPHCDGCHNSSLWGFDSGVLICENITKEILRKIIHFDSLIDNIWILGGEPLDQQKDDLICLLDSLSVLNKKIWIFTRYGISEVDRDIKEYIDYIKCGKFIDDGSKYLTEYGFELASSNQKIYKVKSIHHH